MRVVKSETKEEEEVEVEEEQEESQEPTVPPPAQASMECQTDGSFLSGSKARSSFQKEEPVPPEGSLQKEVSGGPQTDLQQDDTTQLQNLNLPKDFTLVLTSLAMKVIHFFENLLSVLLMVTMVNGQDSAIKVIQLLLNIDICSGM